MTRQSARVVWCGLLGIAVWAGSTVGGSAKQPGILLLAHGGSQQWNDNVRALAAQVNREVPVEVAFGMATRANIKAAAEALVKRGVSEIVGIPLFVSSHSPIITSTEYLLGLRVKGPPELATFAKMSHGNQNPGVSTDHAGHDVDPDEAMSPITIPVPVRMSGALDSHPILASILADRAAAISTEPAREALVLVAHGPVKDVDNEQWIVNLNKLGQSIRQRAPFASIHALTVRDDAPDAIKNKATRDLRSLVAGRREAGLRVLIVPVVLSFGGIEKGIVARLDGLEYVMAKQAIIPDDRLVDWVKGKLACQCN